jgi:hypothetical protein
MDNFPYTLTASLVGGTTNLTGSFTNSSPYTFEDAVIISAAQSWNLGDILPGQTISLDLKASNSSGIINPNTGKPAGPTGAPISSPYSYNNPLDSILGTSNYWQDRETYRRYNFLSSFLFNSTYGYGYMQVYGLYLVAWSSDPVIPVTVANRQSEVEDTTLFMIAVTPIFDSTDSVVVLDPTMFNWKGTESSSNPATPYNMYMYAPGVYGLEFSPVFEIDFTKVQSLVFSIAATNTSAPPNLAFIKVNVFNYSTDEYDIIENIAWGDNEIPNPERYVGANGVIRLKIETDLEYLELGRTDFTLVIER